MTDSQLNEVDRELGQMPPQDLVSEVGLTVRVRHGVPLSSPAHETLLSMLGHGM